MSNYKAVFRCSAGCPGEHSIWQPLYHCPACGGLLQVVHDIDALRHRSSVAWMRLFDDRYKRTAWPYGSGVAVPEQDRSVWPLNLPAAG